MLTFRTATLTDIPFLVQAILSAESFFNSTDSLQNTYCQLFSLTRTEAELLMEEMLTQEEPGTEFFLEGYLLACINDVPVATCCAWVEDHKNPSSNLKAQMIAYLIDSKKWQQAQEKFKLLSSVAIPRTSGVLQLESFYTMPEARGKGLAAQLIYFQREKYNFISSEIQLVTENTLALQAYKKAGFKIDVQSELKPILLPILGGSGKIRMIHIEGK